MNRSDNVFNAAPLGSGGVSGYVFIKAALVCRSIVAGKLRAGRGLSSATAITATTAATVYRGRILTGTLAAVSHTVGRLNGLIRVGLVGAAQARATVQAKLTKLHRIFLSGSTEASASVSGSLKRMQAIALSATSEATASVSGVLSRITRKFMTGNTEAQASVSGMIYRGRYLKASGDFSATTSGFLNESTRSRAAAERTAIVPPDGRSVIVPKGT